MDFAGEHATVTNADGVTTTTYYPQTVTYLKPPTNMVTFKVPANKVAELGGNTEKIKGFAYSQMNIQ